MLSLAISLSTISHYMAVRGCTYGVLRSFSAISCGFLAYMRFFY